MIDVHVDRPSGPGSIEVGVKIPLQELRNQLLKENHPLADAPQWNGDSFYLVRVNKLQDDLIFLITAPTSKIAEEIALANASNLTRSKDFQVKSCQLVELNPGRRLQASIRMNNE